MEYARKGLIGLFFSQYWIWCPVMAPLLGGLIGTLVYDTFFFTGSESILNRPSVFSHRRNAHLTDVPRSTQRYESQARSRSRPRRRAFQTWSPWCGDCVTVSSQWLRYPGVLSEQQRVLSRSSGLYMYSSFAGSILFFCRLH